MADGGVENGTTFEQPGREWPVGLAEYMHLLRKTPSSKLYLRSQTVGRFE